LIIDADPEIGWEFIKIKEWILSVQNELDLSWAIISEYYDKSKYKLTIHRIESNILDKNEVAKLEKVNKFVAERANFKVVPDLLKLLIQPLYGDNPTYGVRELLQNAVDACNEREALGNYPIGEEGKIDVSVDTNAKIFTITDNGIGMTKDVIINHYLSIGSSYRFSPDYLSKFVEDGQNKVSRSGHFGIGVLAMFLIGKSATVTTRSYDEDLGYQFTLEFEQENIEIKRIECEIGTVIEVRLCENTTNYFTNSYNNKRSSWYITHDSHSDYLRYLDWLNWYWKSTPNIVYRLNNNETQTAYNIYNEYSNWFKVESKIFSDYKWQYSKDPSYERIPLFCNGISVLEIDRSDAHNAEYGFNVAIPNISIDDRNAQINLSLSRNKCLEIPDSRALFNEVYKYTIACLLNQRIPCFENGEISPFESLEFLSNMKKIIHIGNTETIYIFSKHGYSIIAEPFLYTLSLKTLRFIYINPEYFNENVESILRFNPFCVGYAGGKYKYSEDFDRYLSLYYEYLDDYLREKGFYSLQGAYDSENRIANLYAYAPYIGERLFIDPQKHNKAVDTSNHQNTYHVCFDSKYKCHNTIELSEETPVIVEYSIKITPKYPNNLMLQLIHEYLMETSDDIWIPFDMDERKKKFPKAFRELEKYMKLAE
jgi:hypothetical protein